MSCYLETRISIAKASKWSDLLGEFALEKLESSNILANMHVKYQEARWEESKIPWKQQLQKMQPLRRVLLGKPTHTPQTSRKLILRAANLTHTTTWLSFSITDSSSSSWPRGSLSWSYNVRRPQSHNKSYSLQTGRFCFTGLVNLWGKDSQKRQKS